MVFEPAEQTNLASAIADYLSQLPERRGSRVPNPRATVRIDFRPGNFVFRTVAPVRGAGLRVTTIDRIAHPGLYQFLGRVFGGRRPRIDDALGQALEAAGLIVAETQVPEIVLFACHLRNVRTAAAPVQNVFLKLNLALTLWSKEEARSMAPESLRACALLGHHNILWVRDHERRLSFPYCLDDEEVVIIKGLISGDRAVASLEPRLRGALLSVGVLANDRVKWPSEDTLSGARERIAQRQYAIIRDLIPGPFLAAMQDYYQRLVANGYMRPFDGQAQRHNLHNEAFSQWLHRQMLPLLSEIIPEPVKPSYSYLAFYVSGARLEKHSDREQCEYTLSLTVKAEPDNSRSGAWPLYLERPDETVEALLAPGDGVIFKGRELPHFRHELPAGQNSGSVLFHYVPASFSGQLR